MSNGSPIRYMIRLPQTYCTASPAAMARVAEKADELGFYGVSVQDHLIAAGALSSCGEIHDHSGDDRDVYEPMQTLAYVAARTERVKLLTGVLVLPFRNAIHVAKEAASLDVFSNGRLIVGVGVGAPRRGKIESGGKQDITVHAKVSDLEFNAFKVKGHRGRITDEGLEVMDTIWKDDVANYHGEYYDFADLEVYPKPIQKPRPPVWIGGRSQSAQRRAVLRADGWCPSQISADMYREALSWMRDFAAAHNTSVPRDLGTNIFAAIADTEEEARDMMVKGFGDRFTPEGRETLILYGTPETFAAKVQRFVDAGVNTFDLKLVPITLDATLKQMELLAKEVAPAIAA